MLIDKNNIPTVAIDSMNNTHYSEIDLINTLYDIIVRYQNGEPLERELSMMVDQLEAHVEQHFSNEEALMLESGFPAYQVHKGEHDRVRDELAGILMVWRQVKNIEPLADYLVNVHPRWAQNHIATMDTMTAYFIAQKQQMAG